MKTGINWTSPREKKYIEDIISSGKIDYVEILIDNFLHLDPFEIKSFLKDIPLSFHIMSSKFLTTSSSYLNKLAKDINIWTTRLNPLYVSDHLGLFEIDGNISPLMIEIDYKNKEDYYLKKISLWSKMLLAPLLLENYPSYTDRGLYQLNFFIQLENILNIKPLFDISNTLVAQKNIGVNPMGWLNLSKKTKHFHCGSFREIKNKTSPLLRPLILDSHDSFIDNATSILLHKFLGERKDVTVTIERDAGKEYKNWMKDWEILQ